MFFPFMLYNLIMKNAKNFRFKFNVLTWILLSLVLAISLAGAGINLYNVVIQAQNGSPKVAITAIMIAVSVILSAFTLSVMIFSKYSVKGDGVYNYFGIIRYKTKASQILQFTRFKASDKLVAYLSDEKYTVIVISPLKYDEFVKAVREINSQIVFDTQEQES